MSSTEFLDLPAARHAAGTVILPGSKSISNRVLLLSALAAGVTRIEGVLQSDDTRVMLAALTQLGVGIETHGPDSVSVRGAEQFPIREADLFLGNAGTAIRPLTAALALMDGHYRLSGVPRMHERPIGDLVDGLREMGARIAYVGREGYPPLEVSPCGSLADRVRVQGSVSSQFLTAVLMAAPLAVARTGRALAIEVIGELISRPYIEITLNLMSRFGVTVTRSGWQQFVVPISLPRPDFCRRRRVLCLLLPGDGGDRRRPGARRGRGRRQHPGRHRIRRYGCRDGRHCPPGCVVD